MSTLSDFAELAKPRLVLLAALMAGVAFWIASKGVVRSSALAQTFVGCYLIGAAASALNQILERGTDARMKRTENRPLPAGRVTVGAAALFGSLLGISGLALLTLTSPLAGFLGLSTLAAYLGVYTPLKKRTSWNTLVGAVPGALPCLIGWAAARNRLDPEAFALFFFLFFWQLPHFFAIAWVYRDDYRSADLRMLSTKDASGRWTAAGIFIFSCVVAVVSLIPVRAELAGPIYLVTALTGGSALIVLAGVAAATRLRFARGFATLSIYYLVVVMSGLAVDRL